MTRYEYPAKCLPVSYSKQLYTWYSSNLSTVQLKDFESYNSNSKTEKKALTVF